MEDTNTILDVLAQLLEPLGSKRKKLILAWVEREIQTHAIVQYVYEEGPPVTKVKDEHGQDVELGGPQVWRIGEPSPLVPGETIFAMFHLESGPVSVYTFQPVEVDGRAGTFFFRSLICKPVHIHGPVHHNALTRELGAAMAEDPDEPDYLDDDADDRREPVHAPNGA